ncbi:MAG: hypothetical protein WB524_14595 [Acidobacteriaceae bacterium]
MVRRGDGEAQMQRAAPVVRWDEAVRRRRIRHPVPEQQHLLSRHT